jgi:hypothetical protein
VLGECWVCVGRVSRKGVAMFGGLGASRSGLYSAPVAPGSYYGSQRLRPGHFCGSTVGKNGSKTPPKGAELTIGLQEVLYYCKEPRRPMAATLTAI